MTFFGTQPTLTQVPPSAPFSQTATLAPCVAARRAEAMPPEPAPMPLPTAELAYGFPKRKRR